MTKTQLIYFEDNYKTNFSAPVIEVNEDENYIVLESTLFYPRGGNQDFDTGYLRHKGYDFNIIRVSKNKVTGEVYHYVDNGHSNELSTILVGETIHGEIDWQKRYAHMKTHTAQHLLSSLLLDRYQADTTDVEITFNHGEIKLDQALDYEQIINIQQQANDLIENADIQTMRSIINSRYHLKIGSIDIRECGGTHVSKLSEIEKILVFKIENEKFFYVVGDKASSTLAEMQYDALQTKALYPKEVSSINDFKVYVHSLQKEHNLLKKKLSGISTELLRLQISLEQSQANPQILTFQAQDLSTKEAKLIFDSVDLHDSNCFVVLCKKQSLVIVSTDSSLKAGELFNVLKLKDPNMKGGGNKNFAQGGPWSFQYSELQNIVSEYQQNRPLE